MKTDSHTLTNKMKFIFSYIYATSRNFAFNEDKQPDAQPLLKEKKKENGEKFFFGKLSVAKEC